MLIGTATLIWAAVKVGQKFMAGPQSQGQQTGWCGILLLVIVSGGLAGGGWSLMNTLGSGGKKSILDPATGRSRRRASRWSPTCWGSADAGASIGRSRR